MKNEIILIGGGGHCKSCIDVIEAEMKFSIAGIVDVAKKIGKKVLDYEIIGTDDDLPALIKQYENYFITIGQIKSADSRVKMFDKLKMFGIKLPIIISPSAYVSKHAILSEGTIVMHHAIINADAYIGKNCIINTKSLIEHDAKVENHCHISTGAIINGGSVVDTKTFIGSNSVVRENLKIGKQSLIGCHERVIREI